MKQWCALLEGEVETWPQVRSRPMFGMRAFYRGKRIFACIPRTRALGSANAIILKFPHASELLRRAGGELLALDPLPQPAQKRRALGAPDPGAAAPRSTPSPATAGARRGPRWLALEINGQEDLRRALEWLDQAYRNTVSAKPN